jgi:transcriptional regulator with XRE-family HTH domain
LIRKQRLLLRVSQLKLSNRIGVSRGYLSKIENKKFTNITLDLAIKISDELELDIHDFLKWLTK